METNKMRRKQDIEVIIPMTPLQQGILSYSLQANVADPYYYHRIFVMNGELDPVALGQAWEVVVARHQVLRTDYRWEEVDTPLQIVFKQRPVQLQEQDWRGCSEREQKAALESLLEEEHQQGFDFRHAADIRLHLIRTSEQSWWCVWSLHHLALDGWSIGIVLRDVLVAYRALCKGNPLDFGAPESSYTEYVKWVCQQGRMEADDYWRKKLANFEAPTPLPAGRGNRDARSYAEQSFELSEDQTSLLKSSAQRMGLTLNTLVQGAWGLLLARHADTRHVLFGSTVSGRSSEFTGIDAMVGMFVNTLPLQVEIDPSKCVSEWLGEVQQQNAELRQYEAIPLSEIQRHAGITDGQKLFYTAVVFENFPIGEALKSQTANVEITLGEQVVDNDGVLRNEGRNSYPLSLIVVPGQRLGLSLAYHGAWLDDATVGELARELPLLLSALCSPERRLGEIGLPLPKNADEGVAGAVAHWDVTDVVGLFSAQVERDPAALALCGEERSLSFAELDAYTDRLAHAFSTRGIGRGQLVGLCIERSPEWVIGMLGILKTGAAYVALDPKWPFSRIADIVDDSQLCSILYQASNNDIQECGASLLKLEALLQERNDGQIQKPIISPQQPAYVIYTSGSTGVPKGVSVSHRALNNYVQGVLRRLALPPSSSMAMASTVAADLGHTVLFGALCAGHPLHLISPERAFDPDAFADYMKRERVTTLKIVPSHLRSLLQARNPEHALPEHTLILGGEACDAELIGNVRRNRPECRIVNHYGPTETTVGALCGVLEPHVDDEHWIPSLGGPLDNVAMHVLDADINPVPAGVPGELYIAGEGLAQGYLNRSSFTAERFVANPWGKERGTRLYRTGDRVRLGQDGHLEFLGRNDGQVKVRGYRVEPEEVAERMRELDGVWDAVVVAQPVVGDTTRIQLIGYCVAQDDTLDEETLRPALQDCLPDYMVPARIIMLDKMPLTGNGKLDKQALPSPDPVDLSYDPPQGDIETTLAEVWAEVIGCERVGRNDNFFELGGDSILSLQIVARSRKRGYKVTPKYLMEGQTVAAVAAMATPLATAAPKQAAAPDKVAPFALLPVQRWFFEQGFDEPHHWNQSVLLEASDRVDAVMLRRAVEAVVNHHGALRLRFIPSHSSWQQAYAGAAGDIFETVELRAEADPTQAIARTADAGQRSLSLEQPFRTIWMDLGGDRGGRLLLVAHHLVVDGVSWRVLLEDLQTAYEQLCQGQAVQLPQATSPLSQWSHALEGYAASESLEAERDYWRALVAGDEPCLPAHDPQGTNTVADARSIDRVLDAELTSKLLGSIHKAYRTQIDDILLTALACALCEWGTRDSVLIELEGHGREDMFDSIDLSRSVGWFTSLYPVRLVPGGAESGTCLKAIKEQLRRVPNKGLGYGVLRYLGAGDAVLAQGAYPQVTFNYLGQFDRTLDASTHWKLAVESGGQARSPSSHRRTWFDVNAMVRGGELLLSWTYSGAIHREEEVTGLLDRFMEQLTALIDHCSDGPLGATPSDFPLAVLTQKQLDDLRLDVANVEDIYPLSPLQQGMLFHSLYNTRESAYLNQMRVDIDGLDSKRFKAAWDTVVERHDILRTGFLSQGERPLQWVARQVELTWLEEDWRERENQSVALDALAQEMHCSLNLAEPPLMRFALVRTSKMRHHFIWIRHHLLSDGWSISQLIGEVLRYYAGEKLPSPVGRYRDYIAWLQARDGDPGEAYWRERLLDLENPTRLVDALPRPMAPGVGHGEIRHTLDKESTQRLEAFAKRNRVTINTLVQAAWALLLSRYSGQRSVCFGATVAGRSGDLAGAEQLIGPLFNTLPVITSLHPEQRVDEWLRELQTQNLASREHEHTPLYEIQSKAGQGGHGLFDSIVVFENFPVDATLRQSLPGGLKFGEVDDRDEAHYPVSLIAYQHETLALRCNYARSQLDASVAKRLIQHLSDALMQLCEFATRKIGEVEWVSKSERQRLEVWGDNTQRDTDVVPVHHLIERQALLSPDATALILGDQRVSYAELNVRANLLAHYLIALGVYPETRVGIAVERSVEMVVGLLAIIKAGGAYVPLDPCYPAQRLTYMVEDSGIELLLTQHHLANIWTQAAGLSVIELDRLDVTHHASTNPDVALYGDNLAYVIYTSGSTGRPKGVEVSHGPLSMHLCALGECYGMTSEDRMLQFSSISFDAAGEQWLLPLLTGASLVLPQSRYLAPEHLATLVRQHGISVFDLTPSYLRYLHQHLPSDFLSVRLCIAGGEAWSREDFEGIRRTCQPEHLFNTYGPTEAVISPTLWSELDDDPLAKSAQMPIGRPVGARKALVLDAEMNLIPPGVTGELYLGGAGLARGYLHRPGLTAESFVADPFGSGERLYRTGDLVRWGEGGQLEYLGRLDHQVNIRGLRIELGEIEAQLLAQPEVREAVVVTREGSGCMRLVAYLVAQEKGSLNTTALGECLGRQLPYHMVPGVMMQLDALPLTPNGKVDRKALPEPEIASDEEYEAPKSKAEEALASIWSEVLGVKQVGRHDNFFALGGHSLLSLKVLSRLRALKEPRLDFKLRDLMQRPTIAGLSELTVSWEA